MYEYGQRRVGVALLAASTSKRGLLRYEALSVLDGPRRAWMETAGRELNALL